MHKKTETGKTKTGILFFYNFIKLSACDQDGLPQACETLDVVLYGTLSRWAAWGNMWGNKMIIN